jgi:hypothetical protein
LDQDTLDLTAAWGLVEGPAALEDSEDQEVEGLASAVA